MEANRGKEFRFETTERPKVLIKKWNSLFDFCCFTVGMKILSDLLYFQPANTVGTLGGLHLKLNSISID